MAFKQVVCSEVFVPGSSTCGLAVFGVSQHDELYFIEGERQFESNRLTWKASGVPIRKGVSYLSPQYNAHSNASELLYVADQGRGGLHHLLRDQKSGMWSEAALEVRVPTGSAGRLRQAPTYLTCITLASDATRLPVPTGYPVTLRSDRPTHATCNGRSLLLDSRPTTVYAGPTGQIDLALPVDPLYGCGQLKLELTAFRPTDYNIAQDAISIIPAQRAIKILSSLTTTDALRSLVSSDGQRIVPDAVMGDMAPLITQFARRLGGEKGTDGPLAAWSRHDGSKVSDTEIPKSEHVGGVFGDVIESLKYAVQSKIKLAVVGLGMAIKLVVWSTGKILSLVIPDGPTMMQPLLAFVKDKLPPTFAKLLDWLELVLGVESIKKTQSVCVLISAAFPLPSPSRPPHSFAAPLPSTESIAPQNRIF